MPSTAVRSDAPLFTWRGVPLAAALSLVLCWPMLVTGELFVFTDTSGYLRGGRIIWDIFTGVIGSLFDGPQSEGIAAEGAAPAELTVNASGAPVAGRSFTYSVGAYLAQVVGGPLLIAWLQGFVVVLMSFALVSRAALARPVLLVAGFVVLAVATTLPFYTVFLIPDGLAAVVVMFGMILAGRLDVMERGQIASATALAALAVTTHYGYMPLIAGLVAVALLWRAVAQGLRPWMLVVAALPVLVAPLANLSASAAVLESSSVTPRRLPILLARSLQDGPARWYLEEACPEADLAFCEAFGDEPPTNIRAFLWDEDGIDKLTPDQMNGIREEEATILVRAFLAFPGAQTASLLKNWGRQILLIGTGQIGVADAFREDWTFVRADPDSQGRRLLRGADRPVVWVAWIGAALIVAVALSGRLDRRQMGMIVALAAGLLGNAAIFGGLSAPVDRYQARIAWLMPFLAMLLISELSRRSVSASGRSVPDSDRPTRSSAS